MSFRVKLLIEDNSNGYQIHVLSVINNPTYWLIIRQAWYHIYCCYYIYGQRSPIIGRQRIYIKHVKMRLCYFWELYEIRLLHIAL